MKTRQKEYDKNQQTSVNESAGDRGQAPGVLTLSASELASLLCACGLLPETSGAPRDRGDGGAS